ncbi:Aste57867_16324 [Aphanomyces stellatus]|uniref:Aste57867_16324 protein n=1 Tax=Aphanomyces stellatus TaxID=120398 RepID=A0A485L6J1_9STRA|nr:hypothetical protein As57867_016267 [Aphanomyces stellatus]VFT93100.1 Aste57867_16324 [Aphanomyces stellatus]
MASSPSMLPAFHAALDGDSTAEIDQRDMCRASFLFLAMGFGYLFPYWALAQPVDYWHLLFPSFNVEFSISCAYNIASTAALVGILCHGGKQRYTGRIVGGFVAQVVVLVVLPASYFVLPAPALLFQSAHLTMVLASTVVVAIAGSFLDSSVFALAALFPHGGAIANVQLGIGLSLLVTALYRDATKAFFADDMVVASTMLYFGAGAITVGGGIAAYFVLLRLPLTRACLKADAAQDTVHFSLLQKVLVNQLLVAASCLCTLLLWPGVVSAIPSYQFPHLNANGWWPLLLMTVYAASDVAGRVGVQHVRLGVTAATIWKLVLPRFLLVPLLVGAATGAIAHDAISIAGVVVLGVTHGYVGTLSVVVVNHIVDATEQSATGMLSVFFLNAGLVAGATLSLGLANVVGL